MEIKFASMIYQWLQNLCRYNLTFPQIPVYDCLFQGKISSLIAMRKESHVLLVFDIKEIISVNSKSDARILFTIDPQKQWCLLY